VPSPCTSSLWPSKLPLMTPSKFPLITWLGALPFFVVHIWLSARGLPPKVATHFNAAGQPDGWMTRETHTISFIILGLGMSTFIVGLCYGIRWFPKARLSIPNQKEWQKPAHRNTALNYIFYHSFWLGTLALAFLASINHFIVAANAPGAGTLATRGIQISAGAFIAGIILWIFFLVRFFMQPRNR
jgi:hypothetical protein